MNKLLKYEKKAIEFCEKNYLLLFFIAITLFAIYARYLLINFESKDYSFFLVSWFDQLKSAGGLRGLKNFPGDYNAPYMTIMALLTYLPFSKILLIKGPSIVFDFVLAFSSGKLVYKLSNKKKELALIVYSIVLFLPNVLLNGAMWGQCETIYTSFIVLAILFLIDEKYSLSFIMLGLAFAFKLQFIFVLPVFIILYVTKKRFSIINFLLIPLINTILCLPAIFMGNPVKDVLLIYSEQTKTYAGNLVLNFPNIYNFISGSPEIISGLGKLVTVVVFALLLFYCISKKIKWTDKKNIKPICFICNHMHLLFTKHA